MNKYMLKVERGDEMQQVYIVTGANGHLGNVVVQKLIEQKATVRALILPDTQHHMIDSNNVSIYEGDVRNLDALEPLFQKDNPNDQMIVIHTAGIVSITSKKMPLLEAVNVGGTKNMIELSMKHNVHRFIYVSSVHAIPELDHDTEIKETDIFDPNQVIGAYAKTKAQATQMVLNACQKGLQAIVVHPSGIIGPNDYGSSNTTMMIQDYLNYALTSRVKGAYDFVDVRDVAEGILKAIKKGQVGETYIFSGHHTDLRNLFELMRLSCGRKYHIHVLPIWFAKATLPLAELYYKLLKRSPIYSKYSLYTLASNAHFSNDKATKQLNFKTRALKNTIDDTIGWLVEQNRVHHKKTVKYVKNRLK
jgi:dihydroflavonol-4-reductase